jgi:hypothetical protein
MGSHLGAPTSSCRMRCAIHARKPLQWLGSSVRYIAWLERELQIFALAGSDEEMRVEI